MSEEVKDRELTTEELEGLLEVEEESTSEEMFNYIALQEEIKRIEFQDEPISYADDEVYESDLYKKITTQAHTIGESTQILLGYGVDYTNALSLANNLVQNAIDTEKLKIQGVVYQSQQP